ncbi:hypothetical protein Tco_0344972 [Tanacetum coccineum]
MCVDRCVYDDTKIKTPGENRLCEMYAKVMCATLSTERLSLVFEPIQSSILLRFHFLGYTPSSHQLSLVQPQFMVLHPSQTAVSIHDNALLSSPGVCGFTSDRTIRIVVIVGSALSEESTGMESSLTVVMFILDFPF